MFIRRILTAITLFALVLSCFSLASCTKTEDKPSDESEVKFGKYIYVSESGDDANSGEESSPLRTFAGAVEAVRKIKADGLPDGGVCVVFSGGDYPVRSTVTFTESDSGEADKPIAFAAKSGETVSLNGGIVISADKFTPASDEAKSRLFSEDAKAKLLEVDLSALGVEDYSDDIADLKLVYSMELFRDGERQNMARYPNESYYIAPKGRLDGDDFVQSIPEDRAEIWANSDTIRYFGYPNIDWKNYRAYADSIEINTETNEITCKNSKQSRCLNKKPYMIYNVFEEIDAPGEYYISTSEKKLYYYPEDGFESSRLTLSVYKGDFMRLEGVSYLTFDGLTFENSRGSIMNYESTDTSPESSDITIKNCRFVSIAETALNFIGERIVLENSELYEIGAYGIKIYSNNLTTLECSGSRIYNCSFRDFSRIFTVYSPAVRVDGYGFYIGHNEMCGSAHEAIEYNCSNSIIEYNYIHDVCSETSDAGACYAGRSFATRGNIFRYNLLENIVDVVGDGAPNGIYCDDCMAGTTCYGNIFYNIGGNAFAMGGGRNITIYNNIVIDCKFAPVSFDERGLGWGSGGVDYADSTCWKRLKATPYCSSALHRYIFPQSLLMEETSLSVIDYIDTPGTPSYAYISRNVAINCTNEEIVKDAEGADKYNSTVAVDNLVLAAASVRLYGTIIDNVAYYENPGIADYEHGNYEISEDSQIYRDIVGFEPIPVEKIGRE